MADYEVVWDGRRDGPGGALLFAEQQTPKPAVPVYHKRSGVRERIIEALTQGPKTSRELAVVLGLKPDVVSDALRPLRVEGRVTATFGAWRRCVYSLVPDGSR